MGFFNHCPLSNLTISSYSRYIWALFLRHLLIICIPAISKPLNDSSDYLSLNTWENFHIHLLFVLWNTWCAVASNCSYYIRILKHLQVHDSVSARFRPVISPALNHAPLDMFFNIWNLVFYWTLVANRADYCSQGNVI